MIKKIVWSGMALLALAVASYAAAVLSVPEFRPPFVRTLVAQHPVAAFLHFAGGALALVVGAFQVNSSLRKRFTQAHRWLGRLYLVAVLCSGAAGFFLALHASGGLVARIGFACLGVFWSGATLNAYRFIRQRDFSAHRRWMIRSYALTFAAVTLRVYLPASLIAGIPFALAYPVISWLAWVPNLIVAEWLVRSNAAALPNSSLERTAVEKLR
jgi:uncharacterized membrane protein